MKKQYAATICIAFLCALFYNLAGVSDIDAGKVMIKASGTTTTAPTTSTSSPSTTTTTLSSGDIASETFNATGYDLGTGSPPSWAETGSPDENSTTSPPIGQTGFATQSLYVTTNWGAAYSTLTLGSSYATSYTTVYIYVTAESLGNSDAQKILRFDDSSNNMLAQLSLIQDGGGVLHLELQTGDYNFTDAQAATFTLNTSYKVGIKIVNSTTDSVSWEIDDVEEGATASGITFAGDLNKVLAGSTNGGDHGTFSIYYDTLDINSSDFL